MGHIPVQTIISAAAAAMCVVGCGGGQGAGSAAPVAKVSKLGDATITYFGQPKPQLTAASGSIGVLGQAGATFSSIALEPAPNLADTYIVFARLADASNQLYLTPYPTPAPQILYQNPESADNVGISAYGAVAFDSNGHNAFTIRPDGTGLKALTFSGVSSVYAPQYAVDGTNRVAFTDLQENLYVAPGTGGTPTKIQSNCGNSYGVWSPNGSKIAYPVATTGGYDVYVTPSTGGMATDVTPTAFQGEGLIYPQAWSADGVTILATFNPGSGASLLVKFDVNNPADYQIITPTNDNDGPAAYSPDGSKILFYRSNANSAAPGIYTSDSAGLNQTMLIPDPAGGDSPVDGGLEWSPFLPKETVVAASGSTFYHQAASGFLLSQNGSQFGSMIAFTANTPSTAAIQAPSGSDPNGPLLFTLTADSITSLGYTNSYFNPGTIVSLSATPSVVVTVDGVTGQIDLVAPAATPKAAPSKNADGTVTYVAQFKAVYDGKGKNLAPNGASLLTVNPKTGKLIGFK